MNIALLLAIIAPVYLMIMIIVLGNKTRDYSQSRHTISELGEKGALFQKVVGWGVFLPVGMLLILASMMYDRSFSLLPRSILAWSLASGYIGAALFPCDKGAPLFGTFRNTLHLFAGTVMYLGASYALYLIGFLPLAIITVLALLIMAFPHNHRGTVQRVIEVLLFGVLVREFLII